MKDLLLNLSSSDILLGIIIIAVLIVAVIVWIIVANNRKKEMIIPKKKIETIEEILQEPVKPPVEDKSAIQGLLDQMAKDLEDKEKDEVVTFEQEQEEKAIISYQQLLAAKKGDNVVKETPLEATSSIEIIDIPEEPITAPVTSQPVPIEPVNKDNSSLEDTKKFRTTEFISPVFGRSDKNVQYRNVDRSEIMAKFTPKEVKEEQPLHAVPPKPVEVPQHPVQPVKETVNMPNTRLGRLESIKPNVDEIVDLKELETTIKKVVKKDEVKKDEEFLKSLIAFRKNLE